MEANQDYYSLLQVDSEAEQDIIEATYKKLCKKYHPDVCREPGAEEIMKRINTAYDVIGDPAKRKAYNFEYKRSQDLRARATWFGPGSALNLETPRKAVSDYMFRISSSLYHDAYELLSDADKKFIDRDMFVRWQKLVSAVYRVVRFEPRQNKYFADFTTQDGVPHRAYRFDIEVTEHNRLTDAVCTYIVKKFAIEEDGKWRVYLGYKDLTEIINEFEFIASCQTNPEMLSEWKSYRLIMDSTTGLLNRKGFIEKAAPDVYRYDRYDLSFYIAMILVRPAVMANDYNAAASVFSRAGQSVKNALRVGDMAGAVGPGRFVCLLLKANRKTCKNALARIAARVEKDCMTELDAAVTVASAFVEYAGEGLENAMAMCEKKLMPYSM